MVLRAPPRLLWLEWRDATADGRALARAVAGASAGAAGGGVVAYVSAACPPSPQQRGVAAAVDARGVARTAAVSGLRALGVDAASDVQLDLV